ncbi:hypothetical protein O181_110811 [Austropuccinia psidii MF-1]|uniref:Uncharacterized protein n=1 Tax=Austropuccinia psidii MF-1 TaxID=1389203 RepID=A0A9Q3JZD0_9BASI|nr:hypothetical protein [Austropuccinia psidii MF-1]
MSSRHIASGSLVSSIYDQADLKMVKKFGLQMMIVEDEAIAEYLQKIVDKVCGHLNRELVYKEVQDGARCDYARSELVELHFSPWTPPNQIKSAQSLDFDLQSMTNVAEDE